MNWTKEKPKCDHECIILTACLFRGEYEYTLFTVEKIWDSHQDYYWGLLDDGEEWGPVEDLHADLYLELPLLKK